MVKEIKLKPFTKISIKINRFVNFYLTFQRFFKLKVVVSNHNDCTNYLGRKGILYIFHFSTRNISPKHAKHFNILFA